MAHETPTLTLPLSTRGGGKRACRMCHAPRSEAARRPAAWPVARQMPLARMEALAAEVAERQAPAASKFSIAALCRAALGMS